MDNISFEFDIKIEQVPLSSRIKNNQEFANIPAIRKHLLLAHQIEQLTEDSSDISLKKIASWLGITYPRIKQITALLFLCPKIQEEILLSNTDKISHATERSIRPIPKEIDWQKQLLLWQNLSK